MKHMFVCITFVQFMVKNKIFISFDGNCLYLHATWGYFA